MKPKPCVAGVILAAGEAKRMGRSKLLLPFKAGTIIESVVTAARQSPLDPVVIVLGHKAEKIQATVDLDAVNVVINPDFRQGQSTSLKAGIHKLPKTCRGAMFLLGDQPRITPAIIETLIHSFNPQQDRLVIPTCQGQRGNPVIIHRALFRQLLELEGDTGARPLFQEFKAQIHWVEMADEHLFLDVDTPDDYRALLSTENQKTINPFGSAS